MRFADHGSTFVVRFSADDTSRFASRWPGSTVQGDGWYEFNASDGALVGAGGAAVDGDGPDWLVFSEDCRAYGRRRFEAQFTVLTGDPL